MGTSSIIFICSCVAAVVGAVVWSIAWRVGFAEGRLTVPLRVIHALAEHEAVCRGRDPEHVARDLCRVLALPERESRRMTASKLRSVGSPQAPTTLRSA
ncbi:hypothetical protein K2Z84_09625 [Candidatus Binatia bacterium]|jgi:hypothetical protein|nr:hypothetical protein [Candidatus Binatia bacterium]